jgi:hypothetical protein
MMKSFKFLLAFALVGALLTYSGCSKSSGPGQTPQDAQLVKLSKTWKATSVTLGGAAQSGYTSFQLVISGTAGQTTFGYSATGRPQPPGTLSPWAASGTFTYGTAFETSLTREDALPITYSVTDTQLQMTFNYTGAGIPSRVGNVQGTWVFTFGL